MKYVSGSKSRDDYDWEFQYPNWHGLQTRMIEADPNDSFGLNDGFNFVNVISFQITKYFIQTSRCYLI